MGFINRLLTGGPHLVDPCHVFCFFPRASERRVLPIVGGLSLIFSSFHLHIFSSSHLLTSHLLILASSHFTSSHLHIFSLHIFSSSHLLIFTSSHLHIFTSSHLLIFTSSHPHIFTSSSHLHILTSSHLLLLPSCPVALLPSCPSCPLLLFYFSSEGGGRGSANETARNATFSHEMRFDRQKMR